MGKNLEQKKCLRLVAVGTVFIAAFLAIAGRATLLKITLNIISSMMKQYNNVYMLVTY
jgi:hypothetical protein